MNTSRWVMAALGLVLGGSVLLYAREPEADAGDAAAQPAVAAEAGAATEAGGAEPAAKGAGRKAARKVRLTKPWKDLSSLSDEQKQQIADIHRKAVQEVKQIQQREREQIMALLTEDQRSEVQALADKAAAARKAKKPAGAAKKPAAGGDADAAGGAGASAEGDEQAG